MRKSMCCRALLAVMTTGSLLVGATAIAAPDASAAPEELVELGASAGTDAPAERGVRDVDWYNASFTVPAVSGCTTSHVDFSEGAGTTGDSVYRFTPDREITYADVTGEGIEDALILMDCGPPNSEYSTALIAMSTSPDGASVQPLGTVASPEVWTQVPTDHTVWYSDIAVAINDWETGQTWTEYYRWAPSAGAFVRIDRP